MVEMGCWRLRIGSWILGIGYRISNFEQCVLDNIWYWVLDIGLGMLGIWVLDIGDWVLDLGWILGIGYYA